MAGAISAAHRMGNTTPKQRKSGDLTGPIIEPLSSFADGGVSNHYAKLPDILISEGFNTQISFDGATQGLCCVK